MAGGVCEGILNTDDCGAPLRGTHEAAGCFRPSLCSRIRARVGSRQAPGKCPSVLSVNASNTIACDIMSARKELRDILASGVRTSARDLLSALERDGFTVSRTSKPTHYIVAG